LSGKYEIYLPRYRPVATLVVEEGNVIRIARNEEEKMLGLGSDSGRRTNTGFPHRE
jgi:hypothetical protein